MEPYIHPHRTLNDRGTEADEDNHSDWQLCEDGHMYAIPHPAYATRTFEADTMSPSTASLFEAQNTLSTAGNVPDDGYTAPVRNFNGYLDNFGSSASILPPAGSFVSPLTQLGERNNLSTSTTLPSTLQLFPSAPNTYHPSTLNDIAMIDYPYVCTLNNDSASNIRPSASVNDSMLFMNGDFCIMPSGEDCGHTMNNEFFENCIADLQYDAPNFLPHIEMTTQHPSSSIPMPEMAPFSYDAGASFSGGQNCNVELPINEIGATPLSFSNFQYPNNHSCVLDTSLTLERHPSLASLASNTMETNVPVNRPLNERWIMPRPMQTTSEVMEVDSGMHPSMKASRRPRRKGKYPENKNVKISKTREDKACASCYAVHVKCPSGDPCRRCVKLPYLRLPCTRDSLGIYLEGFVSPFMGSHLKHEVIENFTKPLEFINNEIFIELSTDPSHPPIRLLVCEFIPRDENILNVPDSSQKSHDNLQSFPNVRSLQWGVLKRHADQLLPRCLEHIQTISNRDTVVGERETLSWKIMQAICRFQQTDPIARRNDLLAKAIKINRLHYILGTNIFFSSASVDEAINSLQTKATDLPSRSRISSRVLTREIKGVMNDLLKELTIELLDNYSRELRAKRPETWLLCLMTHLILCMCAEEVQMQVDSFIVFQIPKGACDPTTFRRCGTEVCRRVEHVVLEHSWVLIRGKLRSLLKKRNPFKYGHQVIGGQIPKETELNLINEIREVMKNHEKEVFERAADPYYGGSSRTPADTYKFRKSNSSRLLSKYLKMLY